jgi:membrane associated rhomboid family serine protease
MTTADTTTCYRHPDRETGRHCTRCGRPACPECLREASVGAQCVDCVKADGGAAPSTGRRLLRQWQGKGTVATNTIIAVTVAAYVIVSVHDGGAGLGPWADKLALYGPLVHQGQWYRLFSVALVHANLLHIGFNMLLLWQVGLLLEPGIGKTRFATIYVVSVLAGSAGALVAAPHTPSVGASGGVVGIAAAAALVLHRQGVRFWDTGFGPLLLIIIFVEPLMVKNISEGAHIGGLIGGLLVTEIMIQARRAEAPVLGYFGAAFVGAASILLSLSVAGR